MKKIIRISGLDCAGCAAELEEEISKVKGITEASVSFVNQKIFVSYEDEEAIEKVKDIANHFEEVRVLEEGETPEESGEKKAVLSLSGLDCAACADELESELLKIDGVSACIVSFVNQKIFLTYKGEETLKKAKDIANHFEEVKVVEDASPVFESIKTTIHIKGLDCAACAAELEEEIRKIEGVEEVSVSFVNQIIALSCTGKEIVERVKDTANRFEEVRVIEVAKDRARVIQLKNLDCANCAAVLQEKIAKVEGVNAVVVDFMAQNIVIDATDAAIKKAISIANHFEKVKVLKEGEDREEASHKRTIVEIILSAALLALGIIFDYLLADRGRAWQVLAYVSYAASYLTIGHPVLISTVKNISKGRIFDENFLMTLASIVAIILGEYTEGVAVMLLYQIGEFLQSLAVGSSRKSIVTIMNLKSEDATLLREGGQVKVKPEELKIGDIVVVKAGEKFPVDVRIVKGKTSVDTKSLTGETALKEAEEGDEILSGCINSDSVVEAEVLREYSDSAVAKILDLVENSSAQKAKPEKFITRFAKYYTPIVCALALAIAVLVPVVTGLVQGGGYGELFRDWIHRALILLIVSCPCALIISIPLTYFGGIGTAAKYGILVKGATYLDTLTKVKTVAFDKTGTLTEGVFDIVKVNAENREETLKIAAALENCSSHPLAECFADIETPYEAESVKEIAGRGLCAEIAGKRALCGNAKLLRENGIAFEDAKSVSTVVYVAYDDKFMGSVEIDDKIKSEAEPSLKELRAQGVKKLVMLTGDNEERAKSVSAALRLDEAKAGLLPDEKLECAQKLKEETANKYGGKLAYVGDGINDAPVMAVSDVAVSMGKVGSAAAIEASDLVLVSDNLKSIGSAFKIAKRTRRIVVENIVFSIVMKAVFMILGVALPSMPLALAVFGDVGVMLLAVLNSLRIRGKIK